MSLPPLKLGLWPVTAFLLFGWVAAFIVPSDYGGNPRPTPPDEGAHVGYVQYLADHLSLPVFRSPNDNYEAHQPPLYYLSALPAYLLSTAVSGQVGTARPVVVGLRLWSVALAALSVWVAWLIGRRVFPHDRLLALAPALFLALWPGRTLILAAVTNDGLAELLSLLTFLWCVVILQEGLIARRAMWLGLAFALALMTKSTSMALGPVVLLAVVMAAARPRAQEDGAVHNREAVKALLIIAGITAIVAGWWFVRNQVLYGDPLAAEAFARLFKQDRATPEYFLKLGMSGGTYFVLVVINTALSFWGVYGQANIWSPLWYYVLGFGIWGLTLAGLVRQRFAPQESPGEDHEWQRNLWLMAWVLLITVVVFFLRFNTEFYQAQARYLFAANAPLCLLTIAGLWGLDRRRAGKGAVMLALGVMLVMSAWSVLGFTALAAAHYPPPLFGA